VPNRRDLAVGCAFIIAVTIAFLAGLTFRDRPRDAPAPVSTSSGDGEFRNLWSPQIRNDPNFRRQQRENVEALEAYCRQRGAMCAKARAARKTFDAAD
jgi:hypothetical protein